MGEVLILVDKNDREIGKTEKEKCHRPPGFLHRAFLIMVFNSQGKILLTKRSKSKALWPGIWDGSVASHPREISDFFWISLEKLSQELKKSPEKYSP